MINIKTEGYITSTNQNLPVGHVDHIYDVINKFEEDRKQNVRIHQAGRNIQRGSQEK